MVDTVAQSLTSILDQIGSEYEVVVVDDGSTDGSEEILKRLENVYENLKIDFHAGNENHGEARNHAVQLAEGEYIIGDIDADNVYCPSIEEFVKIYHQIEDVKEENFMLLGTGIYIAPRQLLIDIPYRSIGYGEDRDLYRRLLAKDAWLSLSHRGISAEIGYHDSIIDWITNGVETISNQFRSGVHLLPYLKWAAEEMVGKRTRISKVRGAMHLSVAIPAYVNSMRFEKLKTPENFQDIGKFKEKVVENHMTLSQMEDRFGISVDRESLRATGKWLYDINELTPRID
ncbi:Glycosyl transferase family 2 [Halanaeroarchaeum sp. HSR-CO]|nr:Glycosyl transferase family 2 [Halanaeroarchaeum sp. HSR-CO]